MENAAVLRRNYTTKKGNKENAPPVYGSKSSVKTDKVSVVPFQLKGNKKEETLAKNEIRKAKAKPADTKKTVGELLSQKTVRGVASTDVKRQTHSQVFLTAQAVRHKKMVAGAPKPPAPVMPPKSAPGMYKGKIIQSKIGSIWKSTDSVATADPKPSAPKMESQRVGNVARRNISKSVVEVPRTNMQKTALAKSRSVTDRPPQVSKPTASSRQPARTVSATSTKASSRNATVAPIKASGDLNAKPKPAVSENKVKKPAVSSTLSQYRFNTETAEERRAKLAEWLASKGKTFKRPAMAAAVPSKNRVSTKTEADPGPQLALQCKLASDHSPEVQKLDSPVPDHYQDEVAELKTHSQTPGIMNTTLDLLESSDSNLLDDPQDRVDDIVVNLCDVLEAMEPPSRCNNEELLEVTDECDVERDSSWSGDECKEQQEKELQDICQLPKTEQVKDETQSNQKVKDEYVESDDDDVMATTPQMTDASVIKYSVKTTPYLQSVKRTIEDEVCASASRRKSNIKDLKFLTPVRRSCRIQRKSSCLPTMLVDHDPCVSSLAELVKLDDDPNAYIYRKNPALLEDLPDQNSL